MFDWWFTNKNIISDNDKQLLLEAWKESVNVQMHFNEMEMKIRTLAVTVISALAGAIGYLLKEHITNSIFITLLIFVGFAAWICFYFMDRFMYHKLLKGAVKAGIKIENKLEALKIDVALGKCIKEASPVNVFYNENLQMHSDQKLDFFYTSVPIICTIGILSYIEFGIVATIIFLILDIIWALYALAKGYNDNNKYNLFYYAIFLVINILLAVFMYFILKLKFIYYFIGY